MDLDNPPTPTRGTKRAATDDVDNANTTPQPTMSVSQDAAPQIIRRHTHRRRLPIAGSPWPSAQVATPETAPPKPPFNVYKAIIRHPNIFFQFCIRLSPPTMHDLFAIDKEFHYRFNKYSTSIIIDYACYWAPDAAYVFSPSVYPELTISDPMLRPMDGRSHLARDVPGLRWTKMVFYRSEVVHEILTRLAMEGHRLPKLTNRALMKFWILMDTKTNRLRKLWLANRKLWTDNDLLLFHLFLFKLDMRFSDPVAGNGYCDLSDVLLRQKSLTTLRDLLSDRFDKWGYDDATMLIVRTYDMEDLDTETHGYLDDADEIGVPEPEWGLLARENWKETGEKLDSALELLTQETIRRGLNFQSQFIEFVIYGCVDEKTGANIPIPRLWRNQEGEVMEEGWLSEEERAGLIGKLDLIWEAAEEGRDEIGENGMDEAMPDAE